MVLNTFFLFFKEKRTYIQNPNQLIQTHLTSPVYLPSQPPISLLTSCPPITISYRQYPSISIAPPTPLLLLFSNQNSPITTYVTTHDLSPFQSIHLFSPSYRYYITLQSPCQSIPSIINKILTIPII